MGVLDLKLPIELARAIVKKEGWEGWIGYLKEVYPDKNLHAVSQDWFENGKYICKAVGEKGDAIIGWLHMH